MRIRRATGDDVSSILTMRRDAERWIRTKGLTQWTPEWSQRAEQRFTTYVHTGRTFCIVDEHDSILAAGSLLPPDMDFWRPDDDVHDAWYIGGLLTADNAHGRGLGAALLDWACAGASFDGRVWLRLDCWRDNYQLHAYYQRHGFQHLRTVHVETRRSGALFQRHTTLQEQPALPHDGWPHPWDTDPGNVAARGEVT